MEISAIFGLYFKLRFKAAWVTHMIKQIEANEVIS